MLLNRKVFGIAALLIVAAAGWSVAEDGDDGMAEVQRLMQDGGYEEAAALLTELSRERPDDGVVWASLGLAQMYMGHPEAAIAAYEKGAEFPRTRATSLYNLACAYGVLGKADQASEALDAATSAGFLDFDLMRTDPDLEILREADRITFPKAQKYETLRARNRVEVPYRVVLPRGYDASRTYPALVSFGTGAGEASSDWMAENVWGESTAERGWIAVHLVAPEDGWINHPSHHALEELLTNIGEEHSIQGDKFHLVGFLEGSRAATTYGSMSARFFQSITTVNNTALDRWDDSDVQGYSGTSAMHFLVSARNEPGVVSAKRVQGLLPSDRHPAHVTVLEGEDLVPTSLLAGGLMQYLDEHVLSPQS